MRSQKVSSLLLLIIFLISCSKKVEVEAVKPAIGSVESTVTTISSGTVEAQNQALLAFGTIGRIAKIYASLGSIVQEGAIIAELENADLKALNDEAEKELLRADELFKNGLVSIASLDGAKRAREVTKINYQKSIMKAPFTGMITAMELKVGEYYQNAVRADNKPSVQIIDLKKRLIKGEIDEIDLQRVAIGQEARVKIPALKNRIFKAKIIKVVPYVSTTKDQDRTSQIELEILEAKDESNKDLLIPVGASADVEIISETKEGVRILPTSVITGTGKSRFLYKIIDGKLVKTPVKLGVGNYERAEILEGINDNELAARPLNGIEMVDGMKVLAKEIKWP